MSHTRSNGILGSLRGANGNNNGFVNLGRTNTNGQNTGFSIHDAFEEEDTDEVIRVYGNARSKPEQEDQESVKIRMERSDSNR